MEPGLLIENIRQYINLSSSDEQEIWKRCTPREFKRGEFINVEGEVNRFTNFIVSGSSRVYYIDPEGVEHVVQLGIEGWWVGDFPSFITQTPATMFTEALEKTSLIAFSYDDLQEVYSTVPKMERFFRILIQKAYASFHKRTLEALSLNAEERYLSFSEAYPLLDQRISQKHIASYLGMTPEFLSTLKKRILTKRRESRNK
jgi:CRP-like cAMP-binding protein